MDNIIQSVVGIFGAGKSENEGPKVSEEKKPKKPRSIKTVQTILENSLSTTVKMACEKCGEKDIECRKEDKFSEIPPVFVLYLPRIR